MTIRDSGEGWEIPRENRNTQWDDLNIEYAVEQELEREAVTTRDIVVAGALPRQQVRQWLWALGVEWHYGEITPDFVTAHGIGYAHEKRSNETRFVVTPASQEQWGQIQEWVRKVTG